MPKSMRWRVVLGTLIAWALVALLWGAQTSLASNISGDAAVPLGRALVSAARQIIPWVPVSLGIIALTVAFPITRAQLVPRVGLHLAATAVASLVANMVIALVYWTSNNKWEGVAALFRAGFIWGAVNFHTTLLVYAFILGLTQAVLYYRSTQSRELHLARLEGQLARARLQALNAQIRPHFLFNTLHTIGQLWRSGHHDDADAVLDHLGALFHKVQNSTSHFEVPVSDELELVREYLSIEGVRFRDRLVHSVLAQENALACYVPPLILQPLVENAVRHGISTVSTAGRVDVEAKRCGDNLVLTVSDDGPGMNGRSARPGSGTGLRNTRERLTQLYGSAATMLTGDAPGGGTLITISIPASTHSRFNSDATSDAGTGPDVR